MFQTKGRQIFFFKKKQSNEKRKEQRKQKINGRLKLINMLINKLNINDLNAIFKRDQPN